MSTVCLIKPKKTSLFLITISFSLFINTVQADNIPSCDTANSATENIAVIATTSHLTDNIDGTITDSETGLIWKKCSEGQIWNTASGNCSNTENIFTWQQALQRAQTVNAGTGENFSQTDWRLPNKKELASIVELRCANPAINNTVFPNTVSGLFWSSSPAEPGAPGSAFALGILFSDGDDSRNGKGSSNRVRLVRSGQ